MRSSQEQEQEKEEEAEGRRFRCPRQRAQPSPARLRQGKRRQPVERGGSVVCLLACIRPVGRGEAVHLVRGSFAISPASNPVRGGRAGERVPLPGRLGGTSRRAGAMDG